MSAREKVVRALKELHKEGFDLFMSEFAKKRPDDFAELYEGHESPNNNLHLGYQAWYSKCLRALKVVNHERLAEFISYYEPEKKRNYGYTSYKIRDYLMNVRFPTQNFDGFSAFSTGIQQQIAIIHGAIVLADDRIADIEATIMYEVLGEELDAAEDLLKIGALRAAGAVSGVSLEQHLKLVCSSRGISFRKKSPTLSDYNQSLRDNEVIDVPTWRRIQSLADIRNLCVHSRAEEPTKDQVRDLVDGAKRVISEIA